MVSISTFARRAESGQESVARAESAGRRVPRGGVQHSRRESSRGKKYRMSRNCRAFLVEISRKIRAASNREEKESSSVQPRLNGANNVRL